MEIKNKKAYHDYFIEQEFEAGIVLRGNEVKSILDGKMNISGAYVRILDGELSLIGSYISAYDKSNLFDVDEDRIRTLLVHKSEIRKLEAKIKQDRITIVPLSVYKNERDKIKVKLGIAKGKKKADKRESEKKKDVQRQIERYKGRV